MSVLNAILAIQDHRATNPHHSAADAVRILKDGLASHAAFAYNDALVTEARLPRLLEPDPRLRVERMRSILGRLIRQIPPAWGAVVPKGRRYLQSYLGPNAQQCFDSAGLYSDPEDLTVQRFWDELGQHFRSEIDVRNMEVGRAGEKLTMDHETNRLVRSGLNLRPTWVALEDNTLGYDVQSYSLRSAPAELLYIEVKASSVLPLRFFLTRNEWETAKREGVNYLLHVWHIPTEALTELTVIELQHHVPNDSGAGRWQQLEVVLR